MVRSSGQRASGFKCPASRRTAIKEGRKTWALEGKVPRVPGVHGQGADSREGPAELENRLVEAVRRLCDALGRHGSALGEGIRGNDSGTVKPTRPAKEPGRAGAEGYGSA